MIMFSPTNDLEPISIQEWVTTATKFFSNDDYIKSAVSLASILTKKLIQMVESAEMVLSDISTDNVTLFVNRSRDLLSVQTIHILLDALNHEEAVSTSPLAACALGNIFLLIFSKNSRMLYINDKGSSDKAMSMNDGVSSNDRQELIGGTQFVEQYLSGDSSMPIRRLLLDAGMPLSICRLVCDLLNATDSAFGITTLEEALEDLANMETNPHSFLFDRVTPPRSLDETYLVKGPDGSPDALARAKDRISNHIIASDEESSQAGNKFLSEIIFLPYHTTNDDVLGSLGTACKSEDWFVINCKFEEHVPAHKVIASALDKLFRQWVPNCETSTEYSSPSSIMLAASRQVCTSLFSAVDNELFSQLCDVVIPSLSLIFPHLVTQGQDNRSTTVQYRQLFQIVFQAICSSGRPVLLIMNQLHLSESLAVEVLSDCVRTQNISPDASSQQKGLLVLGTVDAREQSGRTMDIFKSSATFGKTNVTKLELSSEISLSQLLCLPKRYTKDLESEIYRKTRNEPLSVIQFLQSILRRNLLSFSIDSSQWTWDLVSIRNVRLSDKVAQLITKSFSQLPKSLKTTLQIMSCLCLGSHVEEDVLEAINSKQQILSFDMLPELYCAVKEGFIEDKDGSFKFTHHIIEKFIYELIPNKNRKLLHKTIGKHLLKNSSHNQRISRTTADQISIFCKDETPSQEESSEYSEVFIAAAKYAVAASKYDKAQAYIDIGTKLVESCGSSQHPSETAPASSKDQSSDKGKNYSGMSSLKTILPYDDLVLVKCLLQLLGRVGEEQHLKHAKEVIKQCLLREDSSETIMERLRNSVDEKYWTKAVLIREQLVYNKRNKMRRKPEEDKPEVNDNKVERMCQMPLKKRRKCRSPPSSNSSISSMSCLDGREQEKEQPSRNALGNLGVAPIVSENDISQVEITMGEDNGKCQRTCSRKNEVF